MSNFNFKRFELRSILFHANISRCRQPHLWLEFNVFFSFKSLYICSVLRVKEVPKPTQNQCNQYHVETP